MPEDINQNKLHQEYEDFLEFNARFYAKKGLDYYDVYSQCYLYLYDNYPLYSSKIALKKCVNNKLRTYYNHEMRERHLNYGTNPENISL
jgi:hypothetical protein